MTRPALVVYEQITDALLKAGFHFRSGNRREGIRERKPLHALPFARMPGCCRGGREGILRPEIQIEAAVWPLRLPCCRAACDFISGGGVQTPARDTGHRLRVPRRDCWPEKFVALTRRAGAELADAGGPRDPTLVRHIYDLHIMREPL